MIKQGGANRPPPSYRLDYYYILYSVSVVSEVRSRSGPGFGDDNPGKG